MKDQLLLPLRGRPWTCRKCLQRLQLHQLQTRRSFETAASPFPRQLDSLPADYSRTKTVDDNTLRRVFDSQQFWREFSQQRSAQPKATGLVQNQYLTSPDGFRTFANVSLQKCQAIVSKVLAASTLEEYRTMARDLDRLSDLLCRVIDLSDFIRVIHPDPQVQEAATQAYALMFEYMNVLNTTTGLNEQLKKAAANPEVTSQWSEEEKIVAQILIKDFSNSAIHMPPHERQRFVNLSNDISQLGSSFVNGAEPAKSHVSVATNSLRGLDPILVQQIKRWNRTAAVPTTGMIPRLALRSVHDENVRREVYLASRTSSKRQLHRLEELLLKRAELAKLSGYESFAHMTLSDKMAKSPEAVSNFLTALVDSNRTLVREELSQLQAMKGAPLQPWDHAYYVHQRVMQYSQARRSRELSAVPEFFSLGTVMQGLSRLFDRLYGVRLVPQEPAPGETWNPDVRRLDVVDEAGRHIAVIYCDLFSRPNKHPNPAHFTLRCSREISAEEVAECASLDQSSHPNDGMATAVHPTTKTLRQLPTIALVCDFPEPGGANGGGRPSLLSEHSVRTLFHEMGHAVHSILGQTRLQSISGTRCATDFAELPSVLMEHFATAPAVLSLYARHWRTDEPLSEGMMRSMERDRTAHGSIYGAVENEAQILMALVDQTYHSRPADGGRIDSTALYQQVAQQHSSLPEPADVTPPTSWQGFFGHLYGYGATYYSYIFDRAIANKLWVDVFGEGRHAVDRAAGERYKNEVLRWGGGRSGWECVAGALGSANESNADGRLVEGGDEAMREVGRWGLGRDGVSG
ncbi:mitochondrial intermediate peptidase [Aspergillus viridinutans]|uniref:Mitochondrial intermediate peptidase n=1 Tax=Aspergillus viridinutans TaxID=75553 RepID=A0A9P3C6R4_ASPVI|nr:mitochondrial intermediate peptidase [Aspergillus viridinutans]GIK07037.1 mitochondrial intermediate peptidase [Aspergillus viridinutans]